MNSQPRRRALPGFTLVELMIVVVIVGLLAAVAIPAYRRNTLRTKAAERDLMLGAIQKAVEDYYVRFDRFPQDAGAGSSRIVCGPNPSGPLASAKRPMVFAGADDWKELALVVEGGVYHQYEVNGTSDATGTTYTVSARGDLDGDGLPYEGSATREFTPGGFRTVATTPTPGTPEAQRF